MKRSKLAAVTVAAAIAFSPLGASAQRVPVPVPVGGSSAGAGAVYALGGCVISIMIAAVDKGHKYKEELTNEEALTCGLLYWIREANRR